MSDLLPLLVAVPLAGSALCLLAVGHRLVQRFMSVVAMGVTLGLAIALLVDVDRNGPAVARIGAWPTSIGITYVADRFSALVLLVGTGVLALVLVYALGERGQERRSPYYHPAYLGLVGGVANAFLAGDLFNLFVAFELLLVSSYVLLMLFGSDAQVRSGTTYVVLNTLESMLLLMAVALVYAATGTVSFAELPERLADLDPAVRDGLNLLLLLAFGLKAAVFPLFFWLPDSYPAAPSPVTAVFAGLLTKVGIYAMVRSETLLFPGAQRTLLLFVAGLTMVFGVLGAIAQTDMKRILSFHIISQIGYMVMGVGLGGTAALAATVFFLVHQIAIKTSLFLVEGIIESETGASHFDRVGGMLHRSGVLAVLFLLPAFSLSGIPPFSGFVAKLGLVRAGFEQEEWVIVAVSLAVSLCTLVSMTKIWSGVFWGEVVPAPPEDAPGVLRARGTMTGATVLLVASGLLLALAAGPVYRFCERASQGLADPTTYVAAVVG